MNMVVKIMAVFIPLITSSSVIIHQLYVKKAILNSEHEIIAALTRAEKMDSAVKNEMITAIKELMGNDFKTSIDMLIGLFAIIISVWVGLTIYNAVKKDDFDKLSEKVEDSIKEFDDTLYRNKKLQVAYLCKSFNKIDRSSIYFTNIFSKMQIDEISYELVLNAILIEQAYSKINGLYDNNEYLKMDLFISQGIEKCKLLISDLTPEGVFQKQQETLFDSNYASRQLLLGYASYRYGDFLYFEAMKQYYGDNNRQFAFALFENSLEEYEKALEYDSELKRNTSIYNIMGFIYIKMYDFAHNYDAVKYKEQMEKWKTNAEKYCSLACELYPNNATYVKNLGIAYERNGDLDRAIEMYKVSVAAEHQNFKSRICLISAYLKKAQAILGIDYCRKKTLNRFGFSDEQREAASEYLNMAQEQLEISERLNPQCIDTYYKKGQCCTYQYLICTDGEKEEFKETAKSYFKLADDLNTTFVAHKFHKRNLYEAIGDIEEANKINNRLSGSDVENLKQVYALELKKTRGSV